MVRSCFSLVWGGRGQVLKGVPPVAIVVGETYVMAMAMEMAIVMISHRRMNDLLHLYL